MNVESPARLERLRYSPEIKAALLCSGISQPTTQARFERKAGNNAYWPPTETLAAQFISARRPEAVRQSLTVYGQACWLVACALSESPNAPFAIAVVSAQGAPVEELLDALRSVSRDYWFGSSFFK